VAASIALGQYPLFARGVIHFFILPGLAAAFCGWRLGIAAGIGPDISCLTMNVS
jgi:hypothetical protein